MIKPWQLQGGTRTNLCFDFPGAVFIFFFFLGVVGWGECLPRDYLNSLRGIPMIA